MLENENLEFCYERMVPFKQLVVDLEEQVKLTIPQY